MSEKSIRIRGAKQNNLKNLDLDIPLNALTGRHRRQRLGKVDAGLRHPLRGGQRRYVESFSAYARQFLDRMDKPDVESIEGIPPTIAIDQSRPVRTSRSTVGTMTELHDHFKLLFCQDRRAPLPRLRASRRTRQRAIGLTQACCYDRRHYRSCSPFRSPPSSRGLGRRAQRSCSRPAFTGCWSNQDDLRAR